MVLWGRVQRLCLLCRGKGVSSLRSKDFQSRSTMQVSRALRVSCNVLELARGLRARGELWRTGTSGSVVAPARAVHQVGRQRAPRGLPGPSQVAPRGPRAGRTGGPQAGPRHRRRRTTTPLPSTRYENRAQAQVAPMTVGAARGGLLHRRGTRVRRGGHAHAGEGARTQSRHPGGPEPRGTEGRGRDLVDLPFAMIPTASALSVAAGVRNHSQASRAVQFHFQIQA